MAEQRLYTTTFGVLCLSYALFGGSFNMIIPELPAYLSSLGGEDYKGLIIALFTLTAGGWNLLIPSYDSWTFYWVRSYRYLSLSRGYRPCRTQRRSDGHHRCEHEFRLFRDSTCGKFPD